MDSRIHANKELWHLWTHCLMQANHKKAWFSVTVGSGVTEIEIMPGSFVFGRNTWAKKLKVKPSTLWNQMKKLKDLQYLDIQSDNTCSVVTIKNWELYQGRDFKNGQVDEHPVENDLTTSCKPPDNELTQYKNVKNVKKEKNDKNKDLFDSFWKAYPNKKSKGQAEKAWEQIKPKPDEQFLVMLIASIERALKSDEWLEEGGKFIPHPATWLRAKGWEDEFNTVKKEDPIINGPSDADIERAKKRNEIKVADPKAIKQYLSKMREAAK